jgi:hypothetical protein
MATLHPSSEMVMRSTLLLIISLGAFISEVFPQVTWQRVYGGYGISEGHGIQETVDHGFVVVGSTGSFGNGSSDVYVFKLDSLGERQWSTTLGGVSIDQGWAIRVLPSGGYILAGFTDAGPGRGFDGLVVKLDENGAQQWQRTYGTEGWDFLYDIELLVDGYAVVGGTFREGASGEQGWVMRLNEEGDVVWDDVLGNEDGTEARSVIQVGGGSLVVAGAWGMPDGSKDAFVAKYDLVGNLLWNTVIAEEGDNVCYSAVETSDGGYALGGYSTQSTRKVMMLAKVSSVGSLQWINHIDGGSGMWEGRSIREDYGGGLVLSGITTSYGAGEEDFYMARTDDFGNWISGPSFGTAQGDQCWGMALVSDGGYVMVGTTAGSGFAVGAVYVVKNAGDIIGNPLVVDFDPLAIKEVNEYSALNLFPNPAAPGEGVEMGPSMELAKGWHAELFDVKGRSVATFQGAGHDVASIRVPHVAPGDYLVRLVTTNAQKFTLRLLVQAK